MTNAHLQSIVNRIEKLEEERKAIGSDISDVYSEAKGRGYQVKALRNIVRERKQDAAERAEIEAAMDAYRHELGMAVELVRSGLSLRQAAKQTGVAKSNIHRALAVPHVSHDPETGEVTETPPERAMPEEPKRPLQAAPPAPPDTRGFDEIAGEIPPHLRRYP